MPITVSIVEDCAYTREGLSELINRSEEFRCVSAHANGEAAVAELPRLKPRVVLVDLNLPGISGIETVYKLKGNLPQTQFVMLTAYKDTEVIFNALKAGANGYLLKQTPPRALLAALREVCAGGAPLTSQIARKIVEAFRRPHRCAGHREELTVRENEVLDLLAEGALYKEIADKLQVSYRTVCTHIEHIYGKLHVHSRAQAVARHLRQP